MSKIFEKWLQALGKLEYVTGKEKPKVDCILCAVRDNDERVESLKVYQDEFCFVVLNLYPYNPAHLMCVINRHIVQFTELTKEEMNHIFRAVQGLQILLDNLYSPKGFNIGINQGRNAGASIEHLHIHVLPRYGSELGYIDIFGKARVVVEGINTVKKKIEEKINEFLNPEFFNKF